MQMAILRNNIEHKYFKIHSHMLDKKDIFYDDFAYSITESDFMSKICYIMKCAREALIYLSLAVNIEENKSNGKDTKIPFKLIIY